MDKYLEPTDPDAFVDFPVKDKPTYDYQKGYVVCPKCDGHGGWNLKLNAYPLRGLEDTSENRHKFSHFKSNCGQCGGWGWTSPENTKCIHEMSRYRNVGKCLNEYVCVKCGMIEEIDSSD